jgi:hypothetical protein
VTPVSINDAVGPTTGRDPSRRSWPANALLALGAWLVVSPLVLAPSMWEFADGTDTWPLVPIPSSEVTEPTRAMVARAEWNSVLAGLLTIVLASSVLVASRHRKGRSASAGGEHRQQLEAQDGQR